MNYFLEAFKKYSDFDGRASRKEFWFFFLFDMIIMIIIALLIESEAVYRILITLWKLFVLLPTTALAIRRMHDVNKSGWFILIPIYSIILYCKAGDSLINKYGTKPQELK